MYSEIGNAHVKSALYVTTLILGGVIALIWLMH